MYTCVVILPPGRVIAGMYVTHEGVCILSSPPLSSLKARVDVWLVEHVRSPATTGKLERLVIFN